MVGNRVIAAGAIILVVALVVTEYAGAHHGDGAVSAETGAAVSAPTDGAAGTANDAGE